MGKSSDLRYEARQRGELFYETNEPCKRGHVSRRYTSNGGCVECLGTGKRIAKLDPRIFQPYVLTLAVDSLLSKDDLIAFDNFMRQCALAHARQNKLVLRINEQALQWAIENKRPYAEWPYHK